MGILILASKIIIHPKAGKVKVQSVSQNGSDCHHERIHQGVGQITEPKHSVVGGCDWGNGICGETCSPFLQRRSLFSCHCICERPKMRRNLYDEMKYIPLWLRSSYSDEFLYPT